MDCVPFFLDSSSTKCKSFWTRTTNSWLYVFFSFFFLYDLSIFVSPPFPPPFSPCPFPGWEEKEGHVWSVSDTFSSEVCRQKYKLWSRLFHSHTVIWTDQESLSPSIPRSPSLSLPLSLSLPTYLHLLLKSNHGKWRMKCWKRIHTNRCRCYERN